jgi:hypothetical protein
MASKNTGCFRGNLPYFGMTFLRLNYINTNTPLPGDPSRLAIPIYVFTVESPQPVGARHNMYAVTVETPMTRAGKIHPFT